MFLQLDLFVQMLSVAACLPFCTAATMAAADMPRCADSPSLPALYVKCCLQQKAESEAFHQEMDELRRKNQSLARELDRITMQAEKPLEQQPLSSVSFHITDRRQNKQTSLTRRLLASVR